MANIYVVTGGRADWNSEGGDDFLAEVIGAYSTHALASEVGEAYVQEMAKAEDLEADEFWFEIRQVTLDQRP
jgi:hypothetical protein